MSGPGSRIAGWVLFLAMLGGCVPPPPSTTYDRFQAPLPLPPPPVVTAGARSATDLTIHFIDSGQGNCILVECPGGGLVLDDCGSTKLSGSPLALHRYLDRIIRQYTDTAPFMPRPLAVIATHPDRDHFDLVASRRYQIDPDFVYRVIIADTVDAYPDYFRAWMKATPFTNIFPPNAHGPLRGLHCGLAQIELLTINGGQAPGQPPPLSRHNADSAVIAIRYGGFLAVLPGDAEGPTQKLALKNSPGLHPTLLAASHHGSDTAGSNELAWANATRPGIVVFTAALDNSFGHPRSTSVDNYLRQPSLFAYHAHHIDFYDDKRGPIPKTITKAMFTTGMAGSIDVTVNPSGVVSVDCAKAAEGGC
jgi:beta-lactamase superfamily II metal-dependent hydrolase